MSTLDKAGPPEGEPGWCLDIVQAFFPPMFCTNKESAGLRELILHQRQRYSEAAFPKQTILKHRQQYAEPAVNLGVDTARATR